MISRRLVIIGDLLHLVFLCLITCRRSRDWPFVLKWGFAIVGVALFLAGIALASVSNPITEPWLFCVMLLISHTCEVGLEASASLSLTPVACPVLVVLISATNVS